jgi:hypothetical protein
MPNKNIATINQKGGVGQNLCELFSSNISSKYSPKSYFLSV